MVFPKADAPHTHSIMYCFRPVVHGNALCNSRGVDVCYSRPHNSVIFRHKFANFPLIGVM